MRVKSLALLIVFCFSLVPMRSVQSQAGVRHTLEDALLLMLTSEVLLLEEEEDQELSSIPVLAASAWDESNPLLDDKTMAAILQALKDWRNELDTNCRLLTSKLRSEGKDCEADRVKATCDSYRQKINGEIHKYHQLRGDKRKAPTKIWHFLKRNGRTIWSKIGPVGRTFLRRLGPEIAQTVLSGGSLHGGTLRKLVKGVARSMGRDKIKTVVFQGVERMLQGQIDILQAAGVDICDPDAEVVIDEEGKIKIVTNPSDQTTDGARWECADVDGPVSDMLEARKGNDSAIINYYDVDHTFLYSADPPKLQYNYTYEYSEDWQTLLDDGSLGWVTHTWSGHYEDTSVEVDEYGVFTIPATWTEKRDQTTSSITTEVQYTHNFWGLLPPDNHQTIYLCSWGPREMPTGLETLSPDNFKDRCGPQTLGSWYFECYLTP
jgi:hypothetical protein